MDFLFSTAVNLAIPPGDSEYLYLLLEPAFVYGIGIGLLFFIVAFCLKSTPLQIMALILVSLSALAIFPYLSMKQSAHQRIEKVYRVEEPGRADDFQENTKARKAYLWLYLTTAITAGISAMIGPRRNRLGLIFALLSILFGAKCVQVSLWMHYQEALFSQPHLKQSSSPVQQRLREKEPE